MLIIAHRGVSGYCPENTMAAFKAALDQKSVGIELDVRLTKDGIPVVIHDATINRTSNGKGYIHELTLAELKTYDFGSWFSPKFSHERIPTLEEVLELLYDHDLTLNIEIKNGPFIPVNLEEKILELVYKYNFGDKVIVSSFDHISLKRLRALDTTIKIGFILHMNLIDMFNYIENSSINPYSIHPNHFYLTDEILEEAHSKGIKVFPYTINDKAVGESYRNMGVDGIITNYPLTFK
ncbi:glycerophosphodiester phosphodiesterase [Bacillus sp. REN16]|uniref:glycerophosphodiester phosphodiesterase n=1 Tax=Bacillus sp. REN16 TaxID=2887296 RepID=UPI001E4812DD|nr:glycerophosphodiester phosphodiesterase [Bacillus sp. REN16]MCC3355519.1 glycerophosphodiester phosphodiesterase [Bacillus sp. REN16]